MSKNPPNLADLSPATANPLAFAISESDKQILTMVQAALSTGRMRLAFQPVVLTQDSEKIAFHEGLIRILDHTGRAIPAKDFMPAVEAHEIGREIDCAALGLGLRALIENPELRLSINMSARSIGYQKWTRILRSRIRSYPRLGERLILEITESSAMAMPEITIAFMDRWQQEGIAFAMDDFGAGYTAIRYFRDFYFDILKIDGQFIRNIHTNRDSQVITAALLTIGKHFDMMCVAESVETIEDAECLQQLGVDCLQGYLFGAPTVNPAWMAKQDRRSA